MVGAACGAARLARLAVTGEAPEAVCTAPPVADVVEPNEEWRDRYSEKLQIYRRVYADLKTTFAETAAS